MESIIGFFVKVGFQTSLAGEVGLEMASSFRQYIWGKDGVKNLCEPLLPSKYGNDIDLVLFKVHLKPSQAEESVIKDKPSFSKKEKSIGISIILDDKNFFKQPPELKATILKKTMIEKLDLLDALVKSKKIDLDVVNLKADLSAAFAQVNSQFPR